MVIFRTNLIFSLLFAAACIFINPINIYSSEIQPNVKDFILPKHKDRNNNKVKIIYTSPLPDSKYIKPQANIILRTDYFIDKASLSAPSLFKVVGSKSGIHSGTIILSSDGKTVIFKPNNLFSAGENVSVKISGGLLTLDGKSVGGLSYNFWVSSIALNRIEAKEYILNQIEKGVNNYSVNANNLLPKKFLKKPAGIKDLPSDFPELSVEQSNNPSPGYIFLANFTDQINSPYGNYLMIVDNTGNPVFYKKMPQSCLDFKIQPNGIFTYYDESSMKFYGMNTNYIVIDSFACGNGYYTDVHELRVLPNGNYFLLGDDYEAVDMSQIVPGGNPNAVVEGNIIQELDKNGNVIFQWRSWDHFKITDATHEDLTQPTIDYVHANAIEIEPDGNILLSSRHLDEITNININTGDIIWRLGGKNDQFTFINDPIQFSHQHNIRELPNGNLILYDDGNYHDPQFSRAVEYKIDTINMTAELVWQYRNNPDIYSSAMGSVERLSNGNTFIGWGNTNPSVIEATADDSVALEMSLPENQYSYRALRYPLVFLNSPEGSERWLTNTLQNIIWTSSGVDSVNLDYSIDGGTTWKNIISDYPADSGHYDWLIPAALSNNCKVKISIADVSSIHESVVCDSAFTIDSSLSVELLSFTSKVSNDSVQLSWTIAKGVINSGFSIQRKLGIDNWQTVGFVQSNSNSQISVSYSYYDNLDTTAYVGEVYYRLNQINLNGSVQYLKQIEMNIDFTPKSYFLYNIYPNPFNPAAIIKYSLPMDSQVKLVIYNIVGQIVKVLEDGNQTKGDHRIVFNGTSLSSGVYFALLKTKSLDNKLSYSAAKKMLLLK